MDSAWSGRRMPRLPRPGEWVGWRNPRHAKSQWWDESYGPGPFEVVRLVEHAAEDLPHGVVLKTRLGEREINEVWLALKRSETEAAPVAASSVCQPLRILVADDERDTRDYLQELVARLGHQVFAVETVRQLIELCRATQPDLVLTDIRLPDGEGIAAALEIFRDRPIPFILVSGYHDADTLTRAAVEPIMAYLSKPVKEADLAAAITVAMRRFEQERALRREVSDLHEALEERKLIERAKGALMRRLHVDEASAYRRLRQLSSLKNRKLADLARDILQAEEVFAALEGPARREPIARTTLPSKMSGRTLSRLPPNVPAAPSSPSQRPPTVLEG